MTSKLIHRYSQDADGPLSFTDALLYRPEGYASVDILLRKPGEGVRGFQLIDVEELDAEALLSRLDRQLVRLEASGSPILREGYSIANLLAAVTIENPEDAAGPEEFEEISAVRDFLADHTTPEMIAAAGRFGVADEDEIFGTYAGFSSLAPTAREFLTFLTTGDSAIRAQALSSVPFFARDIVTNAHGICDLVDARAPLQPAFERITGISEPARLKELLAVQAEVVAEMKETDDFWLSAMMMAPAKEGAQDFRGYGGIFNVHSNIPSTYKRLPLRLLRAGASHVAELNDVRFQVDMTESDLGITTIPIDRMLNRIDIDGIPDLLESIRNTRTHAREFKDYTDFLKKSITAIMMSDTLRESEHIDLARVHASAMKVLGEEDLSEDEALELKDVLGAIDRISYHGLWTRVKAALREDLSRLASLKTLIELSTRWHHNTQRLTDIAMMGSSDISWEPILGETSYAGLRMREITSSGDLRRQGEREGHCVGSYTQSVLGCTREKFKLIFSIENGNEILSTFEVDGRISRPQPGRKEEPTVWFSAGQHKAKANREPCPAALRAADALMRELGEMQAEQAMDYTRSLMSNATGLRDQVVKLMQSYGANILDPKLGEVLGGELARVLPPRMRDLKFIDDIKDSERSLRDGLQRGLWEGVRWQREANACTPSL